MFPDAPVTLPDWIQRVALPKYPSMPIPAYVLLGLGVLVLLIGYFAPIKKLPSLLAGLTLLAYYPLAYAAHWFLFRYDRQERAQHEPSKFEDFLFHRTWVIDWSLLSSCALCGLLFLLWTVVATLRKRRRRRVSETARADNPFTSAPAVRPSAPAARQVAKKSPPSPPSDNPFQFV
jgi:predicted lysophospholipase L1 biosynthesis ABC-type transport system permease subunit